MFSEPYHIQIAYGGQVPSHLVALAEFQGDIYLFQLRRVGGMVAPELDVSLKYGGMLPLDKAIGALLGICDAKPPLFQDVFRLDISQSARKRLSESLVKDLERRVALHNVRFVHLRG